MSADRQASGGSDISTNDNIKNFVKQEEENGDDPYDGLTTKEIARLKAVQGEKIGIDKDWDDMTTQEKIYTTFEDPMSWWGAAVVGMVINLMIIISTITFVTETMPENADISPGFWSAIEVICVLGFTCDFVAKSTCTPDFQMFARDPMNAIDFIAIMPFYIELVWGMFSDTEAGLSNLRLIRVVRLARLLRLLQNTKSGNMTSVIGIIVQSSAAALAIPMYFLFLAVVVYASLMYYAERGTPVTCYGPGIGGNDIGTWNYVYGPEASYCDDPKDAEVKLHALYPNASYLCDPYDGTHVHSHVTKGKSQTGTASSASETGLQAIHHPKDCCYCLPNGIYARSNKYESIPDGLWWCVVTFTTVGYGDKFPVTAIGRVIAIMTMITGVFFMAMPLTIVGTAFNAAWEGIQENEMKENIEANRKSTPRSECKILAMYYEFAVLCVHLEQAVISKSPDERLKLRTEIVALVAPMRAKHAAFRKCMKDSLGIYHYPKKEVEKGSVDGKQDMV